MHKMKIEKKIQRGYKKTIAVLVCTVSLLYAAPQTEQRPIDFSMVISGGVSLGAYESGYNWATIKALARIKSNKTMIDPTLRSVAGASAGSINALLTAVYWCQKDSIPYQNSVDDNLFYETWVNLGIEDLIIKGKDPENRSTLFTRKELKHKADLIMDHMDRPIFREGCTVPMGFSVTKVTPIVEEFQGIKIKNQNFSVPFTFSVENGKVIIKNKQMPEESTNFYISIPGIEKDYRKIVDVLFASSAFPGAFQQIKLRYQYKGKIRSNYFIDGGAYDNIPLQLATELNEEARLFIFMDPSNMRKEKPLSEEDEKEEPPVGFLTSSAGPLTSSVEIFQQMKLYQAINQHFRGHPERKLILSSRYHPLTAGYLEHFGAFMDKNFRLYDYHVGVYDAIYHLALKLRNKPEYTNLSQIEVMDTIMRELGVDRNKEALTAYTFFKQTEFKLGKPDRNNRYAAIYYAFNRKLRDAKRYTNDEFKIFLSKLDMRYLPVKKRSFLAYARRDIDSWAKRPLRYVVNRITTLENERAKVHPDYEPVAKAISIAAWGAGTFLKEKNGWDVLPINAPNDQENRVMRNLFRLVPTEISTDTTNGGLSFAYEAYWYHKMGFLNGMEFKPSYNFHDRGGDFVRMDINTFSEFDDFIKVGGGISGFGNMKGSFYERDTAYGANLYIDIMDTFRITYVRRHGHIEDNDYLYLGIENIPSLLYWLNR
jgi:predicted acylesterase/phospholipase RssA